MRDDEPPSHDRASAIAGRRRPIGRIHWVMAPPVRHAPPPLLPSIVVRAFDDVHRIAIVHTVDADYRESLRHAAAGASGHVLEFAGEIASIVQFAQRPPRRDRAVRARGRVETMLVHVTTRPAFRRLGLASTLIAHATAAMLSDPRDRATCTVHWRDQPMVRALGHAGWRRTGVSIVLAVGGRDGIPLYLPIAARG